MVSLPKIDSYSNKERESFNNYSPLFGHYLQLIDKDTKSASDAIRQMKHRHWLECAFATLSQTASTEDICRYWSDRTDEILKIAWCEAELEDSGVSLFAMGKLGSQELNLSSDIDIFFTVDPDKEAYKLAPRAKQFIQLLNANTHFGFAYRVDTSLRPGGNMSPLLPSIPHFFNYFDEYTEAWNRMSFIRLRALFGTPVQNQRLTDYCHRISYPRRLDFSVIEEIKSIRNKIEFQWRRASEPFDIKLHPGGIRDLELYVQSLQVIYGGRQTALQTRHITKAIEHLRSLQVIDAGEAKYLKEFYWHLRTIENHIHIFEDKHSYILTSEIAKKIGSAANEDSLFEKMTEATELVSGFFSQSPEAAPVAASTEQLELSKKSQRLIDDIMNLKSHSLKKSENQLRKKSILNKFLRGIDKIAIDPDLAISIFKDFIFSIRSKSSIFYLLDHHDELLENLAWLFSISPYVGQVLCRRPELIDSFVLGKVDLDPTEDIESLLENLLDYKFLGQMVSIIYLLKNRDIDMFTQQLTTQAEVIVHSLMKNLSNSLDQQSVDILCMGKWSGFELGVQSDLDFVFLTETTPNDSQRKLVRRFVNLITSPTKAGHLYNIDLRLKPNQSSGPLLIEKSQLVNFIKNKAEPWQKQAYLRSRLINDQQLFFKDRMELLWISDDESEQLEAIQNKAVKPKTGSVIDVKLCAGGLVHTELAVQRKILKNHIAPQSTTTKTLIQALPISESKMERLADNYAFLRRFEQILQICNSSPSTKVSERYSNLSRVGKLLQVAHPLKELSEVMDDQQELLKSLT